MGRCWVLHAESKPFGQRDKPHVRRGFFQSRILLSSAPFEAGVAENLRDERMTDANETRIGTEPAIAVERLIDAVAGSRLYSLVSIVIFCLVAFLPGFQTIAPLDRDETRYAIETRAVHDVGDFGQKEQRLDLSTVPPGLVTWLEFGSVSFFGGDAVSHIWVYRLPALFGAFAVVLLTWWMALAFGRPRAALFAAILVATTPLLVAEAHLAKADSILVAAIVLSQGALVRLWKKKSDELDFFLPFLFWTGLGIGVLAKGPIAPLVVGLTVTVLAVSGKSKEWLRRLAPVAGGLWLVAIVLIWFVGATLAVGGSSGEGTLPARLAVQNLYEAPPGTYAVLFYPFFGPAGVFVALAIPGLIDRIARPVFLFAVAWVAPFWLIVELWPAKLPYYILPAFPALALVGATALDEGWLKITGWISTYFSLNLVVWPLLVGVGAATLFFLGEDRLPYLALPFFVVSIVAGAFAFLWFYRRTVLVGSAILSALSAAVLYVGLFGIILPELTTIQLSDRLATAGKAAASCSEPKIVSTGFFEPSLVFYTGSGIQMTRPEKAADFLAEGGCRVAFVEGRRQSIFNQRVDDIGLELDVQEEIRGFNLGNWRKVRIRVFAVNGPSS